MASIFVSPSKGDVASMLNSFHYGGVSFVFVNRSEGGMAFDPVNPSERDVLHQNRSKLYHIISLVAFSYIILPERRTHTQKLVLQPSTGTMTGRKKLLHTFCDGDSSFV